VLDEAEHAGLHAPVVTAASRLFADAGEAGLLLADDATLFDYVLGRSGSDPQRGD
jgi:hypothetical protein